MSTLDDPQPPQASPSSGDSRLHLPLTGVSHLPEVERRLSEVLAAGLSSESEGVEPRRHVVVLPA